MCGECHRVVAVRKGDGMPYAGRHKCHVAEPVYAVPDDFGNVPTTDGDAA